MGNPKEELCDNCNNNVCCCTTKVQIEQETVVEVTKSIYSEAEVFELIWKYEGRKTSMVGYEDVKKWFEEHKKK